MHSVRNAFRCFSKNVKYITKPKKVFYHASKKGALQGIRVLDMTRILAGPYCTMILGDLGAEIIKIENPKGGDDTRIWGPPFVGTESTYYLSVNRNKKSVAVNLKSPEGANLVRNIALKSDVLIENYIPGNLKQYGLSYDDLKHENKGLVYCSLTGYGQDGPWSKRAGYDVTASAAGGLIHITGPEDGDPCKVGVAVTDLSTGLYAYGSILAALFYREKTGQGQHIDCNLLATQVATMTHIASANLNGGIEPRRYGTAHGTIVPYQAFKSKDGYLVVGAGNDAQFKDMMKLIGLDELAEDPNYMTNALRVTNRQDLLPKLSERFKEKSTDEWLDIFEGQGLPYSPINSMSQVFKCPQVIHNNLVQEMQHEKVGTIKVAGPAVKFSETETVLQCPPPTLGRDTEDVLKSVLELSSTEISQLREKGAIKK